MKSIGMLLVLALMVAGVSLAQEMQMEEAKPADEVIQVEAKLGKDVVDRELTEEASTFSVGERAYLWMRVSGATGDSITVTWTHGEHSYDVMLGIGGSPWRTWAYKTCAYAGDWSVSVSDSEGNVLKQMSFKVEEMGMAEPPPNQ